MKLFLTALLVSLAFSQTSWDTDKNHSTIGFSIDHMVISEVDGKFSAYDLSIETDGENFENAKILLKIEAASVSTDNERRDKHLRSEDFFDVEKFKELTFVATSMKKTGDKTYDLTGDLSIHGHTKKITLKATLKGIVKDPWGGTRAGFKIEGELDRYDFELRYGNALETGGLVIGQKVRLSIVLELVKK